MKSITSRSGLTIMQSQKLTPYQFVDAFEQFAVKTETANGISRSAILAQAAWESGWNRSTPGWMFFGVKDTDGVNGNEQLLLTHEYSKRPDLKFHEIISIKPVIINGDKYFKYQVMDYFRKYDSPAECFEDHGLFFFKYGRYKKALTVRKDPYAFIDEIAKAGYATGPNYAASLKCLVKTIEKHLSL